MMRKVAAIGFALLLLAACLLFLKHDSVGDLARLSGREEGGELVSEKLETSVSPVDRKRASSKGNAASFFAARSGEFGLMRISGKAYDELIAPMLLEAGEMKSPGANHSHVEISEPMDERALAVLAQAAFEQSDSTGAKIVGDPQFGSNHPQDAALPESGTFEWMADDPNGGLNFRGRVIARNDEMVDLQYDFGNRYGSTATAIRLKEGMGIVVGLNPARRLPANSEYNVIQAAGGDAWPKEQPWAIIVFAGSDREGR